MRRRKVYYIGGFDPRGAGFYHRLYREESARQAVHHDGATLSVGARQRRGPHVSGWNVSGQWGGQTVSTDYQFLHWDDLVRRHWEPSLPRLLLSALGSYGRYIRCGAFARLSRNFRGPVYSALYPLLFVALVLGLGVAAGLAIHALALALGGSEAAAWIAGLCAAAALVRGGVAMGNRMAVFWLLRIYRFVHGWGLREPDGIGPRIDAFVEWIRQDQHESPCDEVLLIGHSVGSIMAASVAARLADVLPPPSQRRLTLVTLGQCIPLLSLMPTATAFRRDLKRLAAAREMQWLDMNARADSLCFSQANPLEVSGIAGAGRPTAQVVRPFRMFGKAEYARMKRSRQRLHFQYLMASALRNEYDYFRITAGPDRIQPF